MTNTVLINKSLHPFRRKNILLPPSKSIAQRALICASLANGKSFLAPKPVGEDCELLINGLKQLGVEFLEKENGIEIKGMNGSFISPSKIISMGNNGTGVRFLLALSMLVNGKITIDGSKRLQQRPMKEMFETFPQLGISFESENNSLPATIDGGNFPGGEIILDSSRSSQFLSALLLAAPYSKNGLTIHCSKEIVSEKYIAMTFEVMKQFGVFVERISNSFIVKPQTYKPQNIIIESDVSSASYFFAVAAITNGEVTIENISRNSLQADLSFLEILEQMNCKIVWKENSVTVFGNELRGISVDCNQCPDIVPTLAVVAAFAKCETEIKNVAHLRHKESDRISVLARELRNIGTEVIEREDGLRIIPHETHSTIINPKNDHRIAMSFAVAGLRIQNLEITQSNCVEKSFPNFWKEFLQ
ncbi:MAG: 3-phosphoshikimate 1-carboxyvinyltransferase [Ignavibacteriales bacterium]|nr:3-phosphoshikimate 1-carboxyvinyltransferase [Ignavibacteriales bacterium]